MKVPAALDGLIQPRVTIKEVRKWVAYQKALAPAIQDITRDEFDQIVFDVGAANGAMDRAAVVRWVKKRYRVGEGAAVNCIYCFARLQGFTEARIVDDALPGQKAKKKGVACRDVDACNARVAENERRRSKGE